MPANKTVKSKTSAPKSRSNRAAVDPNLPAVSKQTAGGIAGATVGGLVAGPIGAVIGGVAGAMVGSASAAGQRPIERAVKSIKKVSEKPIKAAMKKTVKSVKAVMSPKKSTRSKKPAKK